MDEQTEQYRRMMQELGAHQFDINYSRYYLGQVVTPVQQVWCGDKPETKWERRIRRMKSV